MANLEPGVSQRKGEDFGAGLRRTLKLQAKSAGPEIHNYYLNVAGLPAVRTRSRYGVLTRLLALCSPSRVALRGSAFQPLLIPSPIA